MIPERQNQFFASLFTAKDVGYISVSELKFSEREPEELKQIAVIREDVLGLTDKLPTPQNQWVRMVSI